MIRDITVKRYDIESNRPFEDVIAAYEAQVGTADHGELTDRLLEVDTKEAWEALVNSLFGPSQFMHIVTFDHGHWYSLYGKPAKAKQYLWGNPLIAKTLIDENFQVTMDVPLRVLFWENEAGKTVMTFDLPSSVLA